jgi:hypothetical protein
MLKRYGVTGIILVLLFIGLSLGLASQIFAWEDSSNGVTIYSIPQYNSDSWYYGDDIYVTNYNEFPVFVNVHMTEYNNVQFSVGGSVTPNETRKIGWIVCADSSQEWYYNLNWSWEEEYRAF